MLFQPLWPHPYACCHSAQLAFLKHVLIYLLFICAFNSNSRQPDYNYRGCNLAREIRFFQKVLQVYGAGWDPSKSTERGGGSAH